MSESTTASGLPGAGGDEGAGTAGTRDVRPGKATVVAPSNIAFVKYWGAVDLERAVPVNPSLSMTLSRCVTETTVEATPAAGGEPAALDEILLAGDDGRLSPAPAAFAARALPHLARLRAHVGGAARELSFRVATRNRFPSAAGIASSASGFAALTAATLAALGVEAPPEELSALARASGSGSASRSLAGGYVEWPAPGLSGEALEAAGWPAAQVFPASHWRLADVVAIVAVGPKGVSSLDGHRRAATSPHFGRRLELLPARLDRARRAIETRDLEALGPLLEEEAVDLHLIAMSSRPPIFYWNGGTLAVLERLRELRAAGTPAWATMDAGANVHVICQPDDEPAVAAVLGELPDVDRVIRDAVGEGPRRGDSHLF